MQLRPNHFVNLKLKLFIDIVSPVYTLFQELINHIKVRQSITTHETLQYNTENEERWEHNSRARNKKQQESVMIMTAKPPGQHLFHKKKKK